MKFSYHAAKQCQISVFLYCTNNLADHRIKAAHGMVQVHLEACSWVREEDRWVQRGLAGFKELIQVGLAMRINILA